MHSASQIQSAFASGPAHRDGNGCWQRSWLSFLEIAIDLYATIVPLDRIITASGWKPPPSAELYPATSLHSAPCFGTLTVSQ
jgi:hypothetical protein